jgi:ribosomal protein S18 acetylase RimI-like enzyme
MLEQEKQKLPPEGLTIRYTTQGDADYLRKWLMDPSVALNFPMATEAEIDDAVRRWISFSRVRSSLTAELNGIPCGIVTLYLQAYKKLVHQAEFGIIVDHDFRNKGIGEFLMKSIMRLAKEQFRMELIHLIVNEGNPAINLYKRMGFREFARQSKWLKTDDGGYIGRVFMERFL